MTEKTRKIKGLLILKGITVKSIAQELGVSITFVSMVINQKKKSRRIMSHISGLLGTSYEETWNNNVVWEPQIPYGVTAE